MIVLMFLLYAFAAVIRSQSAAIQFGARFLFFLTIALFTVWTVTLTLSVFFQIPRPLPLLLGSLTESSSMPVTENIKPESAPPCVPMHGFVELRSEAGDYIGAGQTQSLTGKDGLFCATLNSNNDIDIDFHGDDYWNLDFAPPQGKRIGIGEYDNATRAAFHSPVKPGPEVSGAGRGCNTLNGSFLVHRVNYANDHSLAVFVADFEQHCNGRGPALRGTVSLQSVPNANAERPAS